MSIDLKLDYAEMGQMNESQAYRLRRYAAEALALGHREQVRELMWWYRRCLRLAVYSYRRAS